MGRCTGRRCPMQVGYDVENCNQFDCIYRTEINTNYDRIKSMSVEEMAEELTKVEAEGYESAIPMIYNAWKQWLLQEVSENE